MDDHDLFAAAMDKVKVIKSRAKVSLKKSTPQRPKPKQRTHAIDIPSHAHHSRQPQSTTYEPWVLIADGISRDTLKRLAAGRPAAGLSFDLHGMTRDASLALLQQGVKHAMQNNIRALCIVHGRGLHSQGNKPILKHAVYHWLKEGPLAYLILAAIPQPDSGGGACLILLRRQKSS